MFDPQSTLSGNMNAVFQTASNDNVAVGQTDLTTRVLGFFQHGIVDAATSAAVGVYNSLKAVANSFGAELPMTSVSDTIGSAFGEEAKNYYVEHKVQVDTGGFLASALVTGGAAIAGLRALQAKGIVSLGYKAATGFTGSDIVLGSEAAASYRAAVMANPATYSWVNKQFLGAIGWATRQAVTEALVGEGVFMLTHNQSPLLNPNGVSAWESSKDMFLSGLPLLGAFTAGGVLLDGFRLVGSGKAAFRATEAGVLGKQQVIGAELDGINRYNTHGDQLIAVANVNKVLAGPEYAVGSMEELRKQFGPEATDATIQTAVNVRLRNAQSQLDTMRDRAIVELNNAGDAGRTMLHGLVTNASHEEQVSILGNLRAVNFVSPQEAETLHNFTFGQVQTTGPRLAGLSPVLQESANDLNSLLELAKRRFITSSRAQSIITDHLLVKEVGKELIRYAGEVSPELKRMAVSSLKDTADMQRNLRSVGMYQAEDIIAKNLQKAKQAGTEGLDTLLRNVPADKAQDILELIVHAAGNLQSMENGAKLAGKFPRLAELVSKMGLGYDSSRAYFNRRTGKPVTYFAPRANDTHLVSLTRNGIEAVEHTTGKDRIVLPYRTDATDPARVVEAAKDLEATTPAHFDVSAHYAAAATETLTIADGKVALVATDLPMLERAATYDLKPMQEAGFTPTFVVRPSGQLGGGVHMTQERLLEHVLDMKRAGRAYYQSLGYNEHKIAVLLNTGLDFARGLSEEDAILMGKLDYTKPETIGLRYKSYDTKQTDVLARTAVGLEARIAGMYKDRQYAAAITLGEDYDKLPVEQLDKLPTLSQTAQKAGLLAQQLSEFGSLREWASYVGSLVHGVIDKKRIAIERDFLPHLQNLSVREKYEQRAQFSLLCNLSRGRKMRIMQSNGTTYAVDDEKILQLIRDKAKELEAGGLPADHALEAAKKMLFSQPGLESFVAMRNNSAVKLLPEVADLVGMLQKRNAELIEKDRHLAAAQGRSIMRDPELFYAPPLNLRRTPHFAFVVPVGEANAELPKFMIYGATASELDIKRAYVADHYGPRYKVVGNDEVALHKQLMGEYEKGEVFSQWEFDSKLQRTGAAADIQPSLDLNASEALDLMRNWMHRATERQIKQAVELKYADTVQTLKMADKAYDVSAADSLATTRATQRTVFGDTLKVMLNSDSATGTAVTGYRRVNDFIGEHGSKVLEGSVAAISAAYDLLAAGPRALAGKGREAIFDDARLQKLTAELEATGMTNPYKDLTTAMSRSKVITDGRSLMQATRVLNTLVAGTTLRLDWWNSFVNIVSSPLLASGLLREAKTALAGTAEGRRLAELTTVINPGTKRAEPTAAKLFMRAVTAFFSPDGKKFAEELRKRYILDDPTRVYLEAQDFSSLNGRHTLGTIQQKIDQFMQIAQKPFMHRLSEDFGRFIVAHAFKEIAELRGYKGDEMYAVIRNAVDRVHGIHRAHGRFQLFNGVVGQSLGLFQTYMWNVAQQMLRHVEDGRGAELAKAAFMQSTLFGVRSLPAFHTLNGLVADTNSGKLDLYSLAGTDDDPRSMASYVLYGAMSNIMPADLFSRGEFALRYNTVVPINPMDWPSISVVSKAIGNVFNTVEKMPDFQQMQADPKAGMQQVGAALSYGLAHNALNRPLAGWAQLWSGMVTTNDGTPLFVNTNHINYDPTEGFNSAAIAARLLGGKPTAEAILLDGYYRRVAYQTEQRSQLNDLGAKMRVQLAKGEGLTDEQLAAFTTEYEAAGGGLENFHAYFGRQLAAATQSSVEAFRQKLQTNSAFSRAYGRLAADRATTPSWQQDAALMQAGAAAEQLQQPQLQQPPQ